MAPEIIGTAETKIPKPTPPEKAKILIADDHPLIRGGIRTLLSEVEEFEIIGEAANGEEAVQKALQLQPSLVIMDINMPKMNGLEATSKIRGLVPETKILILTVHQNREFVLQIAKAGAHGYLLKGAPPEAVVQALRELWAGRTFFSAEIAGLLAAEYEQQSGKQRFSHPTGLTDREREVLVLITDGMSNKDIAANLGLSITTIQTYRERIMEKLDIHHVPGLTKFAISKGIINLDP